MANGIPVATKMHWIVRSALYVSLFIYFNQMCRLLFSCGEVCSRGSAVLYHVPHMPMNSGPRSCG